METINKLKANVTCVSSAEKFYARRQQSAEQA